MAFVEISKWAGGPKGDGIRAAIIPGNKTQTYFKLALKIPTNLIPPHIKRTSLLIDKETRQVWLKLDNKGFRLGEIGGSNVLVAVINDSMGVVTQKMPTLPCPHCVSDSEKLGGIVFFLPNAFFKQ